MSELPTRRAVFTTVPPESMPAARAAFLDGAQAEARCIVEGMTEDNRRIYDYVKVMAQTGRSGDDIVSSVAYVFSSAWSFPERLRLAVLVLTAGIR